MNEREMDVINLRYRFKGLSFLSKFAYFAHDVICKFSIITARTTWSSARLNSVNRVSFVIAKPKMRRIYAPLIIA